MLSTNTVTFSNSGNSLMKWTASVTKGASPAWPVGSDLTVDLSSGELQAGLPQSLVISVEDTNLSSANSPYTGKLTILVYDENDLLKDTIEETITVVVTDLIVFTLVGTLDYSFVKGDTKTDYQVSVTLKNISDIDVVYVASTDMVDAAYDDDVSVAPAGGLLLSGQQVALVVEVDATGWATDGSFAGTLTAGLLGGGKEVTLPIAVTVAKDIGDSQNWIRVVWQQFTVNPYGPYVSQPAIQGIPYGPLPSADRVWHIGPVSPSNHIIRLYREDGQWYVYTTAENGGDPTTINVTGTIQFRAADGWPTVPSINTVVGPWDWNTEFIF